MAELVLVDLSHIFWSAFHATADQPVSEAFEITLTQTTRLCERSDLAAVCCDWPPYWRKDIAPTYKANREAAPEMAREQLRRVVERLAADGRVIWQARGFEADDVIAGACEWAAQREGIERIVVASNDKDLLQLIGPRCHVLSTRSGSTLDVGAVEEKFGVAPKQMRDLLALMGDKSDNVPGVPGIGPKKAAGLLAEFGDVECLLARIASDPGVCDGDRIMSLVREHREQLELSLRLVTLRTDAPVDYESIFRPREVRPLSGATEEDWEDVDERDDMTDQGEATMTTAEETTETNTEPSVTETKPGVAKTIGVDFDEAPPGPSASPTALARVDTQDYSLALEPTSLGAAYKLARGMFESRLYQRFGNPEAIWAVIIRGREMGLGALTSLDSFSVIDSKPCIGAHMLIARAKAHPDCEYFQFIEGDDTYAIYETKNRRNPKPTRLKYTIQQAERAGLCAPPKEGKQGGPWIKRPDEMLRKTCGVQLARLEYPEALLGAYAEEEMVA